MNTLELTIETWMSYDPGHNNYYFGITFNGLEGLEPSLEMDFVKDMQEATGIISKYDLAHELPESGYHRYVLRNINQNIKMTLENCQAKYPFKNVSYEIDMELLIEDTGL